MTSIFSGCMIRGERQMTIGIYIDSNARITCLRENST